MNLRVRTQAIIVCACPLAESVWADDNNCKEATGRLSVVNNGDGTTNGTITKGGKLDGPTQAVFTSTLTPTPDPTTLSYTGDFSATNKRGALKWIHGAWNSDTPRAGEYGREGVDVDLDDLGFVESEVIAEHSKSFLAIEHRLPGDRGPAF
jgi:hypothetical protein